MCKTIYSELDDLQKASSRINMIVVKLIKRVEQLEKIVSELEQIHDSPCGYLGHDYGNED